MSDYKEHLINVANKISRFEREAKRLDGEYVTYFNRRQASQLIRISEETIKWLDEHLHTNIWGDMSIAVRTYLKEQGVDMDVRKHPGYRAGMDIQWLRDYLRHEYLKSMYRHFGKDVRELERLEKNFLAKDDPSYDYLMSRGHQVHLNIIRDKIQKAQSAHGLFLKFIEDVVNADGSKSLSLRTIKAQAEVDGISDGLDAAKAAYESVGFDKDDADALMGLWEMWDDKYLLSGASDDKTFYRPYSDREPSSAELVMSPLEGAIETCDDLLRASKNAALSQSLRNAKTALRSMRINLQSQHPVSQYKRNHDMFGRYITEARMIANVR